jgi:hypothetical protein
MKRLIGLAGALLTALALGISLTSAPATALTPWQDTATSWTNPRAHDPKVVDLHYATHPNFDRVVIQIDGAIPGGRTHYARHFFYDGSGEPVPIQGASGLWVSLFPARAHTRTGANLYAGPRIARPHFDTLKALAFTGDFEGHVSFAFALTHRADYRIFWLHSPQRLVIDFKH